MAVSLDGCFQRPENAIHEVIGGPRCGRGVAAGLCCDGLGAVAGRLGAPGRVATEDPHDSEQGIHERIPASRGGAADPVAEPSQELPPAESAADPSTPADGERAADTVAGPAAGNPEEEPGGAAATETDWRTRIADAREAGSRAQILADALQSRINVLAADFVNVDDPAQRSVVAADRDQALAELARVTEEIEQHQQMVIEIQEEARRAGVPAGWVR